MSVVSLMTRGKGGSGGGVDQTGTCSASWVVSALGRATTPNELNLPSRPAGPSCY